MGNYGQLVNKKHQQDSQAGGQGNSFIYDVLSGQSAKEAGIQQAHKKN